MSERKPNNKSAPPEKPEPSPAPERAPDPLGFFGRRRKNTQEFSAWALASSMGLSMVLATVMGLLFGYWLDGKLNTSPVFLLIFLFMGIVAGFKNLFVIHKRIERVQSSGASVKNKAKNERKSSEKPPSAPGSAPS